MTAIMFLNSDKEFNYELGKRLGLSETAIKGFLYALCEVKFEVDINEETGDTTILKVDGRNVEQGD